ncbi:MAG: neutral zinc metallopeptidase [Parvularculaceae bacterium]
MVKWRGREGSKNVEDRRGLGAAAGISGLAILILRFVMSRWGLGGVAVLVAGFFALQAVGVDPLALLSGQPASGKTELTEADQEAGQFVSVVLAETEAVWSDYFARSGQDYPEPKLVMFSGQVQSACGTASAAAGPFYCPMDRQVYLDTNFFDELARRFGAPGDFAAAYVVAHEVGHHVQTITGVADQVRQAQSRASQEEGNALQVKMELQADCYAGVWAKSAQQKRDFLEPGDIEEGLKAAAAIGDDTLQKNAGRRVTPESFTHGSSEQRQQWFYRGYESGEPDDCDTFGR